MEITSWRSLAMTTEQLPGAGPKSRTRPRPAASTSHQNLTSGAGAWGRSRLSLTSGPHTTQLLVGWLHLPEGSFEDPSQAETVGGLGNRKNDLVNKIIEEGGVEPYEGSVKFLHQLRSQGLKIAIVTSSQNCTAILKAVRLDHFFDMQVDGNTIHTQHLAGKPAPDTFLMAAKLLGIDPARAVVIEDALSGVEAGHKGNFGLVIGVARKGNVEELRDHGAHLVVNDLGELLS